MGYLGIRGYCGEDPASAATGWQSFLPAKIRSRRDVEEGSLTPYYYGVRGKIDLLQFQRGCVKAGEGYTLASRAKFNLLQPPESLKLSGG